MTDPIANALTHLRRDGAAETGKPGHPVTINFHPDLDVGGRMVIEGLASEGVYRSQFETGVSSGGMTAHAGGDRWNWESRIFGGAYDDAPVPLRPKYGALNHRHDQVGGSRRFGSCHLRLAPHVLARTSFCYPDSHLEPEAFGLGSADALVAMAIENSQQLDLLDNYVEAHVHGVVSLSADVDAIVLDPSFRGTAVEAATRRLPCRVEWHEGFRLPVTELDQCRVYRGDAAVDAIKRISESGDVTPDVLRRARAGVLDYQTAKWVWHCVARFGGPSPQKSVGGPAGEQRHQ